MRLQKDLMCYKLHKSSGQNKKPKKKKPEHLHFEFMSKDKFLFLWIYPWREDIHEDISVQTSCSQAVGRLRAAWCFNTAQHPWVVVRAHGFHGEAEFIRTN